MTKLKSPYAKFQDHLSLHFTQLSELDVAEGAKNDHSDSEQKSRVQRHVLPFSSFLLRKAKVKCCVYLSAVLNLLETAQMNIENTLKPY